MTGMHKRQANTRAKVKIPENTPEQHKNQTREADGAGVQTKHIGNNARTRCGYIPDGKGIRPDASGTHHALCQVSEVDTGRNLHRHYVKCWK